MSTPRSQRGRRLRSIPRRCWAGSAAKSPAPQHATSFWLAASRCTGAGCSLILSSLRQLCFQLDNYKRRGFFDMHHVIIIGGGIGGLTTAIALQRRGIAAHVYEAAPELRTVGAGIWVPVNALQVLERLGVAQAVRQAGAMLERAELLDYRGSILQTVDLRAIEQRYGFATIAIHRVR